MPIDLVSTAPKTDDFTPLSEHQAQTPSTFFGSATTGGSGGFGPAASGEERSTPSAGGRFDPAAFDPAAFDPAAFDPAAFDGAGGSSWSSDQWFEDPDPWPGDRWFEG